MSTSIGGLSTSTSNGIRGYGGLASGLDRDTLIEGMTSGTTSKITQQQQKKQQLEWKQSAVRNIASQLLDFANKYTSSWSSKTNLFSSMFWGRNQLSVTGTNSKYVSVSGSGSSADGVSILGVKQLAQKAKWSTSANVSGQTLSTKEVNIKNTYPVQQLRGKELNFKLGGDANATTYSLTLKESEKLSDGTTVTYDYSTPENAVKAINDQLSRIETKDNKKLSDYVKVSLEDDKFKFSVTNQGNKFEVTGGSAMEYLGFGKEFQPSEDASIKASEDANLIDNVSFARLMDGKSLTFSYNGKTAEIAMPDRAALEAAIKEALGDGVTLENANETQLKAATEKVLKTISDSMQKQLDDKFGKKRVKVDTTDGKLSLRTTKPDGTPDETSTLKLVSGSSDVKYALELQDGMSNRINMNEQLKDNLKLKDLFAKGTEVPVYDKDNKPVLDKDGNPVTRMKTSITINGHDIDVYDNDTMSSLMERINNDKDARVTITYQEAADKFTLASKEDGASGSIKLEGEVAKALFGIKDDDKVITGISGQDAIVAVKYAGSDEEVELIRGTNSFTVDGLTINVKGEFGYIEEKDAAGNVVKKLDPSADAVEIDAQVDADSIVDAVKAMVDEYNAIIELVNKELTTKPDRDYAPLTSEQKKELSEDEIEAWEKKAKEGLLHADSDIRSLSSDLRFIIGGGIAQELAEMGISTSSTYSDNGKLTFDESKFRAALASNPERVQQIFAESSVTNTNGNGTSTGIATALRNVMDKYVNTTGAMESKGILIRKAGHESSPMSVTENTMYKQLQEIEKLITKFQERLETERDRYIKQFTSLETLISQMNSQSGFLSQLGGY